MRMRCPRGEECCPGPPGKAALVSASCPSAGSPHCLPAGSHMWPRAGRRSQVGGGGAGWCGWAVRLRPRGWAPRDAARGVVGGLRGFSRARTSPLSFPERVSLQGRRDLCLPCGAGSHGEAVGDASAWCSGTHTVCVPQVQSAVQFKAPSGMSVSTAWVVEWRQEPQGSSPFLTLIAESLQSWDRRVRPRLVCQTVYWEFHLLYGNFKNANH